MATIPVTVTVTDMNGQTATSVGGSVTPASGVSTPVNHGETTVLSGSDSGNGNLILAQPVTLTTQGTLQSLSFYVKTVGGQLRLGLYSDAVGRPGTKLAETAAFTPVVGWNTQPATSQPCAPGNYWLAYLPQSSTLGFPVTGSGVTSFYKSFTFATMPTTFPASPNSVVSHWSLYATFLEGSSTTVWVNSTPGEVIPPPGTLPAGVTLRAIDGERMIDATTMSRDYYSRNGFTHAVNAGYDNPSFFMKSAFLEHLLNASEAAKWTDVGLNCLMSMQAGINSSLAAVRAAGFTAFIQYDELSTILANNGGALGTETVGINAADEPGTVADATAALTGCPNVSQDHRAFYENYTHNAIGFGDIGGVPIPTLASTLYTTPNGSKRHLDMLSIDIYWFAGGVGVGAFDPDRVYGLPAGTIQGHPDLIRRGCHYGDMIDRMRPWQADNFPAPLSVFIETGGPYTEDTTLASYIQPPELYTAIWSVIIHGGRYLQYFLHNFAGPGSDFLYGTFFDQVWAGQTISTKQVMRNAHALVNQLATVINSPFAIGFATVSPTGWKFGDAPINTFTGFDIMCKYNNATGGDNKFYIFAMPRYSQTTLNQTATFTIKNTGATTVTVINEGRTLPITGGTTFTDTFATGNTVHIYRIG